MGKEKNKRNLKTKSINVEWEVVISIFVLIIIFATRTWGHNSSIAKKIFEELSGNLFFLSWGDNERVEIFLGQLSTSFITVSVLSVLSDKSKIIYWINVVQERLVVPFLRNFYSYCVYIFAALAGSFLSLMLKSNILLFIFFTLGIILVTILAYKMIKIYHNDSVIKKQLQQKYEELFLNENNELQYHEVMEKLSDVTLSAYYTHDYELLRSNFLFIANNAYSIPIEKIEEYFLIVDEHIYFEAWEIIRKFVEMESQQFEDFGSFRKKHSELALDNIRKYSGKKNKYYSIDFLIDILEKDYSTALLPEKYMGNCKFLIRILNLAICGCYNYYISKIVDTPKYLDFYEFENNKEYVLEINNYLIPIHELIERSDFEINKLFKDLDFEYTMENCLFSFKTKRNDKTLYLWDSPIRPHDFRINCVEAKQYVMQIRKLQAALTRWILEENSLDFHRQLCRTLNRNKYVMKRLCYIVNKVFAYNEFCAKKNILRTKKYILEDDPAKEWKERFEKECNERNNETYNELFSLIYGRPYEELVKYEHMEKYITRELVIKCMILQKLSQRGEVELVKQEWDKIEDYFTNRTVRFIEEETIKNNIHLLVSEYLEKNKIIEINPSIFVHDIQKQRIGQDHLVDVEECKIVGGILMPIMDECAMRLDAVVDELIAKRTNI